MSNLHTGLIVNEVFIAFYALLLAAAGLVTFKHGLRRTAGFILLLLFAAVRLAGNILLVVAYHEHYRNTGVGIAGFLLQSSGFTWLIGASLVFLTRATQPDMSLVKDSAGNSPLAKKFSLIRLLHLGSIVALILLIVGFNTLPSNMWTGGDVSLPATIKVSSLMFCVIALILLVLTLAHLVGKAPASFIGGPQPHDTSHGEPRMILICIVLACPLMIVRAVYSTVFMFSSDPFMSAPITKAFLEYAMEVIVVLIYLVMGAFLDKKAAAPPSYSAVEEGRGSLPFSTSPKSSPLTPPQDHNIDIHTYPPPRDVLSGDSLTQTSSSKQCLA